MSHSSSPQPGSGYTSGYASPAPTNGSSSSSKTNLSKPTPKPFNVFTNDGSFLERIQRTKREEEEKNKALDALERKKTFDNRFKNRGKRPPPDSATIPDNTEGDHLAKKLKTDTSVTEYERQLRTFASPSLKDTGTGVRPLVK